MEAEFLNSLLDISSIRCLVHDHPDSSLFDKVAVDLDDSGVELVEAEDEVLLVEDEGRDDHGKGDGLAVFVLEQELSCHGLGDLWEILRLKLSMIVLNVVFHVDGFSKVDDPLSQILILGLLLDHLDDLGG